MGLASWTRLRLYACALVSAGMVALSLTGTASAETCHASNTEQLELCISKANANTEANTIVLGGATYLPGPKTLELTNTRGLQTIEGPTSTPSAIIQGGNIETESPELLRVAEGVTAAIKEVIINHSGGLGGVAPAIEVFGSLTVEASTIAGNTGSSVLVEPSGSVTIRNSTLSDGSADGLVISGGAATLLNDTIAFNRTGGIDNAGNLSMSNTIIAENGSPNCEGVPASTNDHNLDSGESCGAFLKNSNPLLGPLLNDGGSTTLHSLQPGSPAIDAGDKEVCPATDQEGQPRPDVPGTPCDIGADEWNGTPPTIKVPAEIVKEATGAEGAVVTYTAEATSSVARVISFGCSPESGHTFPIGTTTVECNAKDGHGNTAHASFTVTVTPILSKDADVYVNAILAGEKNQSTTQVAFGQIHLSSTELGSEGLECVNLGFGSAWNEGSPLRGLGQILVWNSTGHTPEGSNTELSAACRPHGSETPASFVTDEAYVKSEENGSKEVEPRLRKLSTPWNVEVSCGVRSKKLTGIIKVGVPDAEFPKAPGSCPAETTAAETAEVTSYKTEREEKKGCYATIPAPEGCIRVVVVEPGAGLEVAYGGTLRARVINGVKNGLSASKWKFEGATSGELQCEYPASCKATGSTTGELKDLGYKGAELIQVK